MLPLQELLFGLRAIVVYLCLINSDGSFQSFITRSLKVVQNQQGDVHSFPLFFDIQTFQHPLGLQFQHIHALVNYKSNGYTGCL